MNVCEDYSDSQVEKEPSMDEVNKLDRKRYTQLVPKWQERYMERLLQEYAGIIAETDHASNRFWKLKERISEDVRKPGVQLEMRKSEMVMDLICMLRDGTITLNDLDGFSDSVMIKILARITDG